MMNLERLNQEIEQITLSAIRTGTAPEAVAAMLIQHANSIQTALPIINAMRDCNITDGGRNL